MFQVVRKLETWTLELETSPGEFATNSRESSGLVHRRLGWL